MKERPLSSNERKFILDSFKTTFEGSPLRQDLRAAYDYRKVKISFGEQYGQSEVAIGKTRCLCQVSCEVVAPSEYRPSEGFIRYTCELSPMASPAYEPGRPPAAAIEITRVVERTLKESRAVDVESLCIKAGSKVWLVRVDLHLLNDDGNILDAFLLAAISALLHFRKPYVVIQGNDVVIHSLDDHEPAPLSVYHQPISVSFAFFHDGEVCVVDPTHAEEQVADGKVVMSMNKQNEICAVSKQGKVALKPEQMLTCINVTKRKVLELSDILSKAQADHAAARAKGVWTRQKLKKITETTQDEMAVDEVKTEASPLEQEPASSVSTSAAIKIVVEGPKTATLFKGKNAWEEGNGKASSSPSTKKKKKKDQNGSAQAGNANASSASGATTSPKKKKKKKRRAED